MGRILWIMIALVVGFTLVSISNPKSQPLMYSQPLSGESPGIRQSTQVPTPVLEFVRTEEYSIGELDWVRYRLAISNRSEFPPEMFVKAPELPPCGLNTNASRTWVNIYDAETDAGIHRFCAFTSTDSLGSLWFAVAKGQAPPDMVYVVLTDRKTGIKYRSNSVLTSPQLPSPNLVFTRSETFEANSQEWLRFWLEVTNRSQYPDELFRSAPDLPPCGLNTDSSRTWVDIYDAGKNQRINAFCGLKSSDGLKSLSFAASNDGSLPKSAYIVLRDRQTNKTYTSNTVVVLPPTPTPTWTATPTWTPTATPTWTPTATPTWTPTATPTWTPTPTPETGGLATFMPRFPGVTVDNAPATIPNPEQPSISWSAIIANILNPQVLTAFFGMLGLIVVAILGYLGLRWRRKDND